MLTSMRRGASSWIAKILFALLILSFGTWGIVDYLQPDPDPVVITVGDTEIRQSTVRNQFTQALQGLRNQLGSSVTREFAAQMGLDQQVIDSLVDQQVLTREARRMGMRVSEELLRAAIAQNPAFQGPTGQFDRTRYQQVLFRSGMSEEQFLAELQGRMLREPLLSAASLAPPPPDPIVKALHAFEAERRETMLLHRAHDDIPVPPDPGDGTLRSFYEEQDNAYIQPELRHITSVILDPERIAESFAVSEEQLRQEYENRRTLYYTPERREVAQLLFQDPEEAASVVERLETGETWETVAEQTPGVATDLGTVQRGDMLTEELGEAAFGPTVIGFAGPVETAFGHHVLWIKEIEPESVRPLSEVREEIEQAIALDMAVEELIERANIVEDTIAAGGTLEEAADAASVPLVSFDGISRTGRTASGQRPENLPQAGQFLSVAFQLDEGQTSILTETPDGGYFVLRVDRVVPETTKPFEQVRGEVLEDWTEAQRADKALQEAEALAEALRASADPRSAAADAGFQVAEPPAFTRDEVPSPATAALVDAVFQAREGEVLVQNGEDRVFVATVEAIEPPKMTENAIDEELVQSLDRDRRIEVAQAFQEAIRERYEIDIDRAAIDNLLR